MNQFFADKDKLKNLRGQAIGGGMISMAAHAVTAVVQLATTIVLARILAPEDYGLVAIAYALTSFAPMLIDLGLSDALVQRKKITPNQVSALFWINLAIGCLIALVLFLGSPFVASIYSNPELEGVTAAFALTFVFSSLAVQHKALLKRSMRFKDVAAVEIVAAVGGTTVAIIVAMNGGGYWSLVLRPIVAAFITAAGVWLRCDWRPGLSRIDGEAKSMLKFGVVFSGGAVINIASRSADRIMLGFIIAPGLLGFYQNALGIYESALGAITMPLHSVGVSALSRLQGDKELLKKRYSDALSTVTFFSMPAFAILAVIGKDLVPFLLGDKWAPAGGLLSILALGGIVQLLQSSQNWLHLPLGRPDRWARWSLLTALITVGAVVAGLPWGVEGVVIAIVVMRYVIAVPSVLYAGRPIGITCGTVLRTVGKQFLGAMIVLAVGNAVLHFLPGDFGRITRMAAATVAGLLSYLAVVAGVAGLTAPLRLVMDPLMRFVPRKLHP